MTIVDLQNARADLVELVRRADLGFDRDNTGVIFREFTLPHAHAFAMPEEGRVMWNREFLNNRPGNDPLADPLIVFVFLHEYLHLIDARAEPELFKAAHHRPAFKTAMDILQERVAQHLPCGFFHGVQDRLQNCRLPEPAPHLKDGVAVLLAQQKATFTATPGVPAVNAAQVFLWVENWSMVDVFHRLSQPWPRSPLRRPKVGSIVVNPVTHLPWEVVNIDPTATQPWAEPRLVPVNAVPRRVGGFWNPVQIPGAWLHV